MKKICKKVCGFRHFYSRHRKTLVSVKAGVILLVGILFFTVKTSDTRLSFHAGAPSYAADYTCGNGVCDVSRCAITPRRCSMMDTETCGGLPGCRVDTSFYEGVFNCEDITDASHCAIAECQRVIVEKGGTCSPSKSWTDSERNCLDFDGIQAELLSDREFCQLIDLGEKKQVCAGVFDFNHSAFFNPSFCEANNESLKAFGYTIGWEHVERDYEENVDNCPADCAICGDRIVSRDESCDEGEKNNDSYGSCNTSCHGPAASYCGDGRLDEGHEEACDDGNTEGGDGCSKTCQIETMPVCSGDYVASCRSIGRPLNGSPQCYNFFSPKGYQCEVDENDPGLCQDSTTTCIVPAICGDGRLDEGHEEACDDGNTEGGDGCSKTCQIETDYCSGIQLSIAPTSIYSGDILVFSGQTIVSGYLFMAINYDNPGRPNYPNYRVSFAPGINHFGPFLVSFSSAASGSITGKVRVSNIYDAAYSGICNFATVDFQYCGDGAINGPEVCDDGQDNGVIVGGCNATCDGTTAPVCGNAVQEEGEMCDDGNLTNSDGCSSLCEEEYDCEGTRAETSCSAMTNASTCNTSYSTVDGSQCYYDGSSCVADISCKIPYQAPSCTGKPATYSCASISAADLNNNGATLCQNFYSATSNIQCTYNPINGACKDAVAGACTPSAHGVYVSYDTNSVQDTVETKVHLPNQNCTILNNDDAYTKTTDKNGIFFFEVQCPSIDTEKTIQILADVSWLEDDSTILVPNVRTLAKDGIWYEDNGKAFVAKDKFGIGMTNTQRTNNWKSAVYGRSLEQTHNNLGRGDAIKNNGKIVLQNTNLELPTGQSIIEKATTLVSADEKANIEIPENTAIISQLGMGSSSEYKGVFMAPSKVGLSTTPALNLEEVLPTSDNLERVYKFGAENNNKTLYAKDGDATGINKAFTITMETSAAIGATVDVWYSQDGITRTLYTGAIVKAGEENTRIVVIEVEHLTYYAIASDNPSSGTIISTDTTNPNSNPNIGGGGGGGSYTPTCPSTRDCSSVYYNTMCGPCTGTNKTLLQKVKNLFTNTTHRRPGDITDSPYFKELNDAYLFAYQASITTMPTIQKAKLDGTLLRSHLAKMLVQYAVGILDKKANTNAVCSFIDIKDQSPEMQYYAITACQLGLMGIDCDGTPTQRFNPNDEVTRAQFGAVLSRLLYGQKHSSATDTPRYTDYLSSLHEAGIMKDISQPERKELRGYVMLMLMRAMK